RIGLNEVQVGLYPGPIIHRAFERLVGTRRAASLLVRGALLGPDEALAAGLVDEVVAPEDVVTRALAFAGELASLPASALRRTRALVRGELVSLFTEAPAPLFEEANAVWFDPETQQRLRELFARKPV
ncbi:MAG TPA: enoyl-CoA hydratase/isomerase family protein, partial [Steroidobacteraceae bacterium]|nr:enoyl-CoA hydratase/isomerase family protein [Steroidobacteraceae bacterium]